MEMKNREQRRREKFGKAGKVHQHNPLGPWPEIEANPALKNLAPDEVAVAPSVESSDDATETKPKPAKAPRPAAKAATNTPKG